MGTSESKTLFIYRYHATNKLFIPLVSIVIVTPMISSIEHTVINNVYNRPAGRNFQRGVHRLALRVAHLEAGGLGAAQAPEALGYLDQNPAI